jgi:hypothetical protein
MGFNKSIVCGQIAFDFTAEIGQTDKYIVRRLDLRAGKEDYAAMQNIYESNKAVKKAMGACFCNRHPL